MKLKCIKCGFITGSISDWKAHQSVHERPHNPAKNYLWWLGTHLDTYISRLEIVDGLNDFIFEGTIMYIGKILESTYHDMYLIYLKGTCRNVPCWECLQKNVIRTMPEKRYMRYKMQKESKYEPDRPRTINRPDEMLIA